MTITTSKQLAEALGPEWKPRLGLPAAAFVSDSIVERAYRNPWRAGLYSLDDFDVFADTPEAAVLTLAAKLRAEADALERSIK